MAVVPVESRDGLVEGRQSIVGLRHAFAPPEPATCYRSPYCRSLPMRNSVSFSHL